MRLSDINLGVDLREMKKFLPFENGPLIREIAPLRYANMK
jgi:hypothetical protein